MWLTYFVTTFRFVALEPRLRILEVAAVGWTCNLTVIAACSFTCCLFMVNRPSHASGLPVWTVWALVLAVIGFSVISPGNFAIMKWLAIVPSYGFGVLAFTALAVVAFTYADVGFGAFLANIGLPLDYFPSMRRFAAPVGDDREF